MTFYVKATDRRKHMANEADQANGTTGFLLEMGMLKRAKRSGWWIAGVKDPETIAEHSFRTALVGAVLAMMEGADPAKVALMCVFHDTQETRIGDIPHIGRRYLDAASNEAVTADQVSAAHPAVATGVQRIVEEYEHLRSSSRTTPTSWTACSRPWSTASRDTRTSRAGSTPA
jgi:putative hydrolase of HD superfamily